MITLPGGLLVDALGYSKAERLGAGISAEDKAKLLADLEDAGMAGATLAEKLDYLNTPKEYTQTPSTMYGSPSQMSAMAGLVQDRMMAIANDNPAKPSAVMLSDLAFKRSQLLSQEGKNAHRDALSVQSLKNAAIALGLITQAEFDAHFTILPDGFQEVIRETPASHVLTVLGQPAPRIIVEAEDIS